ncbi:hypothetical protein [Pseudoalteromonas ruthenica]|uniref:hypothetical protein n=1 Tax=Pseudoalteromonas ruthenica TaxID=151081 RepID=UPI00241E01A3|nr:hypothetical protein [Pseudoalteromonas ruthenica]|tara:strand:- start:132007 stop:132408 length:402 start_codon:yes stop_codon:yes gene_type:complete
MKQLVVVSTVVAAALLSGCKSTPPRVAQDKTVSVNGTDYVFGGVYNVDKNKLELSINGDPAMKGSFPPYTPTLNMSTKYKGEEFSSYCYFGSVLQEQGGAFGAIAGVIQGSNNKSGDKCEIKVAGEIKEHLYF